MNIHIFCDFDGTLTKRDGQKTINADFYQSLYDEKELYKPEGYIKEDGDVDLPKRKVMKDQETVMELFRQKFGVYNSNFNWQQADSELLMSPEAVDFLHKMLESNDITVKIVTRNRTDYIQAMMRFQGFSENEIAKLTVAQNIDNKKHAINLPKKVYLDREFVAEDGVDRQIYIFDDSKSDCKAMRNAAIDCHYSSNEIHSYSELPGKFEWNKYSKEIQERLTVKSEETTEKQPMSFDNLNPKSWDSLESPFSFDKFQGLWQKPKQTQPVNITLPTTSITPDFDNMAKVNFSNSNASQSFYAFPKESREKRFPREPLNFDIKKNTYQ